MIQPTRRSFIAVLSSFLLNARTLLPEGIGEFELFSSGSLVHGNIALHRAAYQSGSVDDDHTAHLVTDGFDETYWESPAGQEAWIAIDLGETCTFHQISLHWGTAFASGFRLQTSNDGLRPKRWTDIHTASNATGGHQSIPIAEARARHVRLLVPASAQPSGRCILYEFEVQGSRKPASPRLPQPSPSVDGTVLLTHGNWKLQSAKFVQATAQQISSLAFDDNQWLPAVVPGTVLGSYLALGAVPDPWFGDQMSQISEEFFSRNDFWFRDTFVAPQRQAGKRTWIHLDGINWKADIYLNGTSIGHIDGAFLRGRFDVTDTIRPGQTNCLAVLIHHVEHCIPGPKKATIHRKLGNATTNGDLIGYDSPTFMASAGWNWLPIVRGREIGIWQDVWLETTGDVTIVDPWVTTHLPDHSRAELTIRMELANHASSARSGKILGAIGDLTFEHEVQLAPGETRSIVLTKAELPMLSIANPRLWWPNGYGDPELYTLSLRFEIVKNLSDTKSVRFGIRDLQCREIDGVLTVFVNGTRILLRGGNWGMAEGMLNCDAAGYDLRVRLHRDANLTLIRNWMGMEGHPAFYDACDRYGILVWDDFWLAHLIWDGLWLAQPGDEINPSDPAMFLANARDKIRRVRSHASLALYCGKNEGTPPPQLDEGMRQAIATLDGTRHYIPNSAGGTVSGLGPYDVKDPEWYFANRGKDLHSEQGIVTIPVIESMRAMMPEESLWPINDMWAVHDYQEPRSRLYTEKIAYRYGEPTGVEDYCRKAQLLNLESAKAIYECLQANQGSGLLIWMTQAAWPSLICQLYDHYFEMTGAYFGAKTACEPIHILWDANTDIIKAANNTPHTVKGLTAEAKSFDLHGREVWHKSIHLDLPETSAHDCFAFTRPTQTSNVFFLQLKLHQGDRTLSDNFYWGSAKDSPCTDLDTLPTIKLQATAQRLRSLSVQQLTVSLTNPTRDVALAVRLKVQRKASGERVLPVLYSDNFFSLLPGASRDITVEFAEADLAGDIPKLIAEGWNVAPQEISIP